MGEETRQQMMLDALKKLFREKGLMLYVVVLSVLFFALYYIRIPGLDMFLRTDLVGIGS